MMWDGLRKARRELNLSTAGLAEALGYGSNGQRRVRRMERGEIPVPDVVEHKVVELLDRQTTARQEAERRGGKAVMATLPGLGLLVLLAACTTASPMRGPDGSRQMLIACGAATPMSNCYGRAEDECPQGYRTVRENRGFNRAELVIECEDVS